MNTNEHVIEWMQTMIDSYSSSIALAQAAIDEFEYENLELWIWDAAQELWDMHQEELTGRKYG